MTKDDPWRVPALREFGQRFRDLERRETREARARRGRRLLVAPGAIGAAAVASILFFAVGGAGARSAVSEAPAAAIRSGSVRFTSAIVDAANNEPRRRYTQAGEIDFRSGNYRTRLALGGVGAGREWRRVGGVLYLGLIDAGATGRRHTHWISARLGGTQHSHLAIVPGGDVLTDPFAVLRLLANVHAPARLIGEAVAAGAVTRRYLVKTTLDAMLRASSARAATKPGYRDVRATLTVSLDNRGRPIRVAEKLARAGSRHTSLLENTTMFIDYGSPVVIGAPAGAVASKRPLPQVPSALLSGPTRLFESLLQE